MALTYREEMTPREREEWDHDKEMFEAQANHAKEMKLLELEVLKTEARITSWFKIPLTIIKLPILILFIIPLSIYAATKQDIPDNYWKLLR